ncbi:MAG: helix-turn-helix domain-containing protein, partial [Capnocytophaga gingivalis]
VKAIYRKSRVERRVSLMLKAYRYRIYPNKEQEIQLAKTFGCCRFVYNQTLAYRKNAYEKV